MFFADGRRESWRHSIRAYTVVEVKEVLQRAGLDLLQVYGHLDGRPYTIESPAAVFVAAKPGDQ